jgi:hypothetical protein
MKRRDHLTGPVIMALIGHYSDQWRALTLKQRTLVINSTVSMCIQRKLTAHDAVKQLARRTTTLEQFAVALEIQHHAVT